MFAYLLRLTAFASPLLALMAFFELVLSFYPNSGQLKHERLVARLPAVQTLILGSSHAYRGIDPGRLPERAFNLANASQDLHYDRCMLDWCLARPQRVQRVILDLSYPSLRSVLVKGPEYWRSFFYEHYFGIPSALPWWQPEHYSFTYMYGPPLARTLFLQVLQGQPQHEHMDADGSPLSEVPQDDYQPPPPELLGEPYADKRMGVHHAMMDAANVPGNLQELERLMQTCGDHRIQVVLVSTPVYETYRKRCRPDVLAELRTAASRLSARYHTPYLDHMADPRFGPEDFEDCDHLDHRGRHKLTDMLVRELARTSAPRPTAGGT